MADGEVKITIGADDSELKKKLDETEEGLQGLGDKQKETQKETEKTKSKFEELAEAIDRQEKELKDLKGEYIETAINLGENSKEAQALKEKFSTLNTELKENKARYQSAADSLEDLEDSSQKSGKGFSLLDGVISTFVGTSLNDLAGKALEVVGSLIALADETREYREDMAKLTAGFKSAGHETETAQKAYDGFYKLLGESDRTVEAVNHLAELTTNTEEVAKWTDIAAGVTAKFGDSLPIEGLTEAANETAKVGAVTGPLADALNWAGISEDAFNEKLKACNSEQERAALITNTLSTEYATAAAEYNTLTASTQAARDATNRMEQAQAELGATIEPLTTWWTNAKASMLSWAVDGVANVVGGITSLSTNTDILTEKQRTLVNEVNASAQAYKDAKTAAAELAAAQMADVDYATNMLLPQLQELVDSNGRVKQGYEERATFIMGQLNEAYGTEYTRISEIIGKNGELTQSITNAINAKKAQILLEEQNTAYENAIKNINAEMSKRDEALAGMAEHAAKLEEIEKRKQEIFAETEEAYSSTSQSVSRDAAIKRAKIIAEYDAEKAALDEVNEAYNTSNGVIEGYNKDISVYTEATTLMMQGKTAEAISYLQNLNKEGYQKTESQAKKTADEQKAAVEDRLKTEAITLGLLVDEYNKNETKMTKAQKKEMNARIDAAKKQVEATATEAKNLGSNLVEGIGIGADGKKDWLSGKLGGIVTAAIDAAKKAGIIKSPSRKMRDEVGKMLAEGMAVGIDEWADRPAAAMHGVFDKLDKAVKEEQKKNIKTVAGYQKDLENLLTEHNNERARIEEETAEKLAETEKDKNERLAELEEKYIEDKKKKGADKVKLEKEYNKNIAKVKEDANKKLVEINKNYDLAIEKENERYANERNKNLDAIQQTITAKMQEIVSLGNTYQDNVKKIWEDLDKSITDLQANYDNQLANRTASIASSLNLWNAATKNKVSWHVLQNNLSSQVKMLDDYNKAIATLEERNVSTAFINSLKEMGVGATGEIETLAKMTDKQLTTYVELWEKKNALAKEAAIEELEPLKAETEAKIAEVTSAALDKYAELRAQYQEQGALLMGELKQAMIDAGGTGYDEIVAQVDDYTSAGEDLMGGVIAGIVDKSPELIAAVTTAVNQSIAAAKNAAGIASPSKVMKKEVGANLADGVKVGWADKIDTVKNKMAEDMQGITARIKTAVSIEQARMAQGVGVRDTGFTEVAQAVGMQTAGINSLASEYRRGSSTQVTVPLVIGGRELGRAILDLGSTEAERIGTNLSFT